MRHLIDDPWCQRRAQEAFAVIQEAMKRKNIISRRERVATER
jgi:hypothetical protein